MINLAVYNTYRADYADEEFEIIGASNDNDALKIAYELEKNHGVLFNLTMLDDEYDDIKTII